MIATLIATMMIPGGLSAETPLSCPVMPASNANFKGVKVDYSGVRVAFCCGGCDATFSSNPGKFLNGKDTKGKVYGYSLFDPVTMMPVVAEKAKGSTDYMGVRYYFLSEDNKAAFAKDMKKFGAMPKKESLFCPVSGEAIEGYAKAAGYADVDGTRFYLCCADCVPAFAKDPKGYAEKNKSKVTAPKAIKVK